MAKDRKIEISINDTNNSWDFKTVLEEHLGKYYGISMDDLSDEQLSGVVIYLAGYAPLNDEFAIDDVLLEMGFEKKSESEI